jgi:hypothetical protein
MNGELCPPNNLTVYHFDELLAGNTQAHSIVSHDRRIGDAQPLVIPGGQDQPGVGNFCHHSYASWICARVGWVGEKRSRKA